MKYPFAYALASALLIAACAGSLTRSNVALPALSSVWQRIRVDIEAQLQSEPSAVTAAQLAMADAALATDDPLWRTVARLAPSTMTTAKIDRIMVGLSGAAHRADRIVNCRRKSVSGCSMPARR
jgi:hypothetical protein